MIIAEWRSRRFAGDCTARTMATYFFGRCGGAVRMLLWCDRRLRVLIYLLIKIVM